MMRRILVAVVLGCAVSVAAAGAATTTRRDSTRAHAARKVTPFALTYSYGREHDDNVLQLTQGNLDLFTTRPGPPRFLISDVGDMAHVAGAGLRWRARLWNRRESRLALDGELTRHDHDTIADWEQYGVSWSQELTASKRHLLTLDVFSGLLPRYYLGEITDLDASVAAGTRIRAGLTYRQLRYGFRLRQALWHDRLEWNAGLEREHRDYNSNFNERDNDNDSWRIGASFTPWPRWGGTARVQWLRGDLNARGNIPDPNDVVENDISYDHDGIGVSLALPYGHGPWRGRLDASFMPEVRTYTTTDKFDVVRFGRENHRRDVGVRMTQRIWGPLDAIVSWSRLTSRAEFHQGITFPAAETNFNQEQFGVEVRGRYEFALH